MGAASAPAGPGHGSPDAAARHAASDLSGVSMDRLERQVRATARRLGRRPGSRPRGARARAAQALGSTDPAVVGRWGPVQDAPVVPVFTAVLPNGKVLLWDSVGDRPVEDYAKHDFTRAAVLDPATGTSRRLDVPGFNLFCAGYVQLPNGDVFIAGGNANAQAEGIRQTHVFHWRTETWSRGPDMIHPRWYPSLAATADDEVLIVGGGPTFPEVRSEGGALRELLGAEGAETYEYPFLQIVPDGRALSMGPEPRMTLTDHGGDGYVEDVGARDAIHRSYGSFAPFDVGRFLVAGGGDLDEDGAVAVPTRTARVIDSRSGRPVAAATGSMALRRRQHQLTTLADGTVLASGGMSTTNGGGHVALANATYAAERWDPRTGAWTTLASATVARQYHSTAALLPDGRVLTGGGGVCTNCQKAGYLRRDVEVFSPPYLFRKDGSGQLASRPQLTDAPATASYDATFSVGSPQAARIRKLALVRLGAPTHGVDQGQRYVPLSFEATGDRLVARAPDNPNVAPAGAYLLFAVDEDGVPSVARVVSLRRPGTQDTQAANLALGRPATSSTACSSSETADRAVNGTVGGGTADSWCSRVPGQWLQVDLGAGRTVRSIVVRHAGAGGGPSSANTRGFRLRTSVDGARWTTVARVSGNAKPVTTHAAGDRAARYVRLEVTDADASSGTGTARVYELEALAPPATPVPRTAAPLVAFEGLERIGKAQRFEVGRYDAANGELGVVGEDAIRSFDVAPGHRATLCRDRALGTCTVFEPGHHELHGELADVVSSLRVAPA